MDETLQRIEQKLVEPLVSIMAITHSSDTPIMQWMQDNDIHQVGCQYMVIRGESSLIKEKLLLDESLTVTGVLTESAEGKDSTTLHIIKQRAPETTESLKGWRIKKVKNIFKERLKQ
tara:strand:+ start:850 stop:1200 length:351 start_codon:yes stop_codon:yes gene_type:complete